MGCSCSKVSDPAGDVAAGSNSAYINAVYYPSWKVDARPPSSLDLRFVSHVFYAFARCVGPEWHRLWLHVCAFITDNIFLLYSLSDDGDVYVRISQTPCYAFYIHTCQFIQLIALYS